MKTVVVALAMTAGSSNDRQLACSRRKCQFCFSYSCSASTGVPLSCYTLLMPKWVSLRYYSLNSDSVRLSTSGLTINRTGPHWIGPVTGQKWLNDCYE